MARIGEEFPLERPRSAAPPPVSPARGMPSLPPPDDGQRQGRASRAGWLRRPPVCGRLGRPGRGLPLPGDATGARHRRRGSSWRPPTRAGVGACRRRSGRGDGPCRCRGHGSGGAGEMTAGRVHAMPTARRGFVSTSRSIAASSRPRCWRRFSRICGIVTVEPARFRAPGRRATPAASTSTSPSP